MIHPALSRLMVLLLLSSAAIAAIAAEQPAEKDTFSFSKYAQINWADRIETEVVGFSNYSGNSFTVYLKERGSADDYLLPLVIGGCEALALSDAVNWKEFPRPLTYTLMGNILDSLGVQVVAVAITQLKDNTFYAVITLQKNGQFWEIDARPSDAMNLAIRKKSKIFANRKVFREASISKTPENTYPGK